MELTQSYLKSIMEYDPTTGVFTRLVYSSPNAKIGDRAGTLTKYGYVQISINRKFYAAHRLAFLYITGTMPPQEVDHINGIRDDNRWVNLRAATPQENQRNRKRQRNNTSGVVGVSWCSRYSKWVAYIKVSRKMIRIGWFEEKDDAIFARKTAELMHGFHRNHGRD